MNRTWHNNLIESYQLVKITMNNPDSVMSQIHLSGESPCYSSAPITFEVREIKETKDSVMGEELPDVVYRLSTGMN